MASKKNANVSMNNGSAMTCPANSMRSWQDLAHRIEPWFPIVILVLIGLGAWLIALSHNEFSWSDGWVVTSVATLVIMLAYGGAILAPNGKRLHAMIEDTPEGSVPDQVHAAVMNPLVWAGLWGEMGLGAGIVPHADQAVRSRVCRHRGRRRVARRGHRMASLPHRITPAEPDLGRAD